MSDEPVVAVTFCPQAWQNDYAVNVDPQGPTSWQVPASRQTGIRQHTYASDDLRNYLRRAERCRDWTGPFEIEWDPLLGRRRRGSDARLERCGSWSRRTTATRATMTMTSRTC